jgi:hypothetical protein
MSGRVGCVELGGGLDCGRDVLRFATGSQMSLAPGCGVLVLLKARIRLRQWAKGQHLLWQASQAEDRPPIGLDAQAHDAALPRPPSSRRHSATTTRPPPDWSPKPAAPGPDTPPGPHTVIDGPINHCRAGLARWGKAVDGQATAG